MRSAIAYVRVSTEQQGESGLGLDGQMIQIERFAKAMGYRIRLRFREVTTAMGRQTAAKARPQLVAAMKASDDNKWPIIVAGLDRISRNTETMEIWIVRNNLRIISAKEGEHHNHATIQAAAARAQHEGEEIGRRTREALEKRKEAGVKLGNRTNLREAQLKGAAAAKEVAALRRNEFDAAVERARAGGARNAREIIRYFKESGFTTPRGQEWTEGNFYRAVGKSKPKPVAKAAAKPSAAIAGPDRILTQAGIERLHKAMKAKGFKAGPTGKLMVAMGFNRYDTSIAEGLHRGRPLSAAHLAALEKWISTVEAESP